jgi:hypothetical protein
VTGITHRTTSRRSSLALSVGSSNLGGGCRLASGGASGRAPRDHSWCGIFPIPKINCSRHGGHASCLSNGRLQPQTRSAAVPCNAVSKAPAARGTIVGLASLGSALASARGGHADENRVVGAGCRNCGALRAGSRPVGLNPFIRNGNNNYSISRPSLMRMSFPYAALRCADCAP